MLSGRLELTFEKHYDFHFFILNRTVGYDKQQLFSYACDATPATPANLLPASSASTSATPAPGSEPSGNAISTAASRAQQKAQQIPDSELEGFDHDPSLTKVVDRRWFERNKHIYPASTWEEFDATRDYSTGVRKDTEGNAFFFGRR